ncbi:MAG: chemotaxis protein [Leptolyngbya sp. SIO4C1]|nr:chemotaxis protein [Leptolyngbya sp. SIO4C1]
MIQSILNKLSGRVTTQLHTSLGLLTLFAVLSVIGIYRQIESTANDARIVNYAGIVRGKTQRLMKLAYAQSTEPSSVLDRDFSTEFSEETAAAEASDQTFISSAVADSETQEKIEQMIGELDQILAGLTSGSQELDLIRLSDSTFQGNMQQLNQAWEELKRHLSAYQANPTAQNHETLLATSEAYWDLTNETVFSAEAYAKQHIQQSKQVALALFIANFLVLAIVFQLSQRIRRKLENAVSHLSTASSEISVSVTQQERVANQRAASVNETTITMDELETSSRQSAEQANAAVAAAKQALQRTEEGSHAVGETLEGMSTLKQKVDAIAEQIVNLSGQADQIGGISALVADFANQTNMLALNSSVEAMRAGEYGKGFAVVANEIRKLSDHSQQSAEKIGVLVNEMQKAVSATVMTTEEGTKTVKIGVQTAEQADQAFQSIKGSIDTVVANNQQVSLTLKRQVDAIRQVVEAMAVIDRGSKETAAGLTQTQTESEHLRATALVLQQMV